MMQGPIAPAATDVDPVAVSLPARTDGPGVADDGRGGPYLPPNVDSCRTLWACVLMVVARSAALWRDGCFGTGRMKGDLAATAMRAQQDFAWMGGHDFRVICAYIGLDDVAVLEAFRARRWPDVEVDAQGRGPVRRVVGR